MCHMADGRWSQRQMWQHSLDRQLPGLRARHCWLLAAVDAVDVRDFQRFNSYRSAKQQHNAMHDEMSNHTS